MYLDIRLERLKGLREDKDLKQSDVAKLINVTQCTYINYEMGKRQIPIDILIQLALYYNTSIDYILGLTDERKPYPKSILINNN